MTRLVLPPLQQPLSNFILLDDIHMCAPARQSIAVYGIQQCLANGFEEVFGREVGFPETFAGAEELVGGGAGDDEVFGEVDAADGVEAAIKEKG